MRRAFFWFGWVVLAILPVMFFVEVYMIQDLPKIQLWKWAIPFVAIVVIYFSRNRDDVLKHHVV